LFITMYYIIHDPDRQPQGESKVVTIIHFETGRGHTSVLT
jgi:hypothetical protein